MQPSKHTSLTQRLRSTVRAALIGTTAFGFASVGGVPVLASELDDLKAQVEILMRKMEEIEAKQAETAKQAKELLRYRLVWKNTDPNLPAAL